MTKLQIQKKAVTQEDARDLLTLSYAQEVPYGVPTRIIHPAEFKEAHHDALYGNPIWNALKRRAMHGEVKDTLSELINQYAPTPNIAQKLLKNKQVMNTQGIVALLKEDKRFSALSHVIKHPDYQGHADAHVRDRYKAPIANLIVAPRADMTAKAAMHSGLPSSKKVNAEGPGFAEQWQFHTTEHEKAHGFGASEPPAEMMAGIVTRQAFEDCSMLSACADKRAIVSILAFEFNDVNPVYGWSLVDINDLVRAMSERTINDFSEEQFKDIRFQNFAPLVGPLTKMGHIFRAEISDWSIAMGDYEHMAEVGDRLRQDNRLEEIDQQIMTRFTLACRRYAIGEGAYDDDCTDIPDELLESERAEPVTFVADEFIPE